jgi:hypothetical protein
MSTSPISLLVQLIAMLPHPYRDVLDWVLTLWAGVLSPLIASLPAATVQKYAVLRALAWLSLLTPKDAPGTLKLPFTTPAKAVS